MSLFDTEPYRRDPIPARSEPEQLSAGRRLTLRQKRDIERGWHPLSKVNPGGGLKLAPAGTGTCGGCRFREPSANRSYPKCLHGAYEESGVNSEGRPYTLTRYPRVASSAQTDCRAWWPACTDFEPREVAK